MVKKRFKEYWAEQAAQHRAYYDEYVNKHCTDCHRYKNECHGPTLWIDGFSCPDEFIKEELNEGEDIYE